MTEYVIVSCGAKKRPASDRAWRLYTGSFFRSQWKWATAIAPPSRIRILSALHGIVSPMQYLDPYDLKMGQPGSVTADTIRSGLPDDTDSIITSCSGVYLSRLRAATDVPITAPFSGGMGVRMGQMTRAARRAKGLRR